MISFTWPVAAGQQAFPITRGSDGHLANGQLEAVDIACPDGTPLAATMDAVVQVAVLDPNLTSCGRQLDFGANAPDGHAYIWRYCHMRSIAVVPGQQIFAGQIVGVADTSGVGDFAPTGPHLHAVLFIDGVRVRPEDYLFYQTPPPPQGCAPGYVLINGLCYPAYTPPPNPVPVDPVGYPPVDDGGGGLLATLLFGGVLAGAGYAVYKASKGEPIL